MWRFWWQHVVRYALRHRVLALANVLSVGLGVAVYLAIQVTNRSAERSFAAGVDLVAGRAHLEVRGEIDDALFPQLQAIDGVTAATPLVEGMIVLPDFPGEYLHLVGVDPLTNSEFRNFAVQSSDPASEDQWFGDGHAVSITKSFAATHGLKIGDSLKVEAGENTVLLTITYFLNTGNADSHLAVMDIGWAQELLGRAGTLSAVLFRVRDPKNPDPVAARIAKIVPANVRVEPPSNRSAQVAKMLAGFHLNLTALSLVSLLVGVFLVYNTISASVVRRREEIGVLRSVGVSSGQVRWLFLGEALLYGLIGSLLGIAGGLLIARSLLRVVSTTISNVYVLTSIEHAYVPWEQVMLVFLLGLGAALFGAWVPAQSAVRVTPLQALTIGFLIERSERPTFSWIAWSAAAALVALASAIAALRGGVRNAAFLCALSTLITFCLLAPFATYWLGRSAGAVFHSSYLIHLAAQNLVRSLFRNAITIAALASAAAMLVSVSIMIFSFRATVDRWISRRLAADLFVTPTQNEIVGFESFVSADLLRFLEHLPEVDALDTYREYEAELGRNLVALGVVQGSGRNSPQFIGGADAGKLEKWHEADTLIASEPLARRLQLREGQSLVLTTPEGSKSFTVAGIFYDYSRDSGLLLMQRSNFEKYWHDPRIHSVAAYLKRGISPEQVVAQIRRGYSRSHAYAIHSNRELRREVDRIFDQTFAVTYLLRGIATLVAVIGITLNLIVLVKERERELAVLRALGASVTQIAALILAETFLLGVLAVGIGITAGCILAFVLTEVINKTFFGWTIPLQISWEQLSSIPLILIPIALLAGLAPAIQAGRVAIVDAIRT
ncbi:MAG TPA: FtsX-like permease family protein [Chthoniobacterales bacterium]|nr:FtsX-like permease family protein [Chthoniobacterales bacterium]